jgi:hypothetical protein
LYRRQSGAPFSSEVSRGLAVHQRQGSQVLAVQVQQIEQEENQRSLTGIGRVLDKVERRSAIGQDSAEFAVEVAFCTGKPPMAFAMAGYFSVQSCLGESGFALCLRRVGRAFDIRRI